MSFSPHKPRLSPSSTSSPAIIPQQPPRPNEIYRDAHLVVVVDESRRIVWNIRSSEPFPSLEAVNATLDGANSLMETFDRPRYALLTDLRAAPGRNDPAFEAAMARRLAPMIKGFRRLGVLVKTAAGALQIQRLTKKDGTARMVSADEDELVKYLTASDHE